MTSEPAIAALAGPRQPGHCCGRPIFSANAIFSVIDGGSVTAPNLAIWTEDGFVVENEGVPPDIEVEQTPADVIAGHDPQLEKAIEVALAELKSSPPKKAFVASARFSASATSSM